MPEPLLQARHLVKHYPLPGGWLTGQRRKIHAVDDVSLEVYPAEVLGLVGESGCGKTTMGRLLLGLIRPTAGQVMFQGGSIRKLTGERLQQIRRDMQIVFQNPTASLSPRMKVLDILTEPLVTHKIVTDAVKVRARALALLELVGMGEKQLSRFPHELSGGQCQRVAIARALALNPKLIVLDEPTSALDVSVQAQIINLLEDIRARSQVTYVFISHDLSVVQHISHRIGVMYLGKLVEISATEEIFREPLHPYTQALLSAIPLPVVGRKRKQIILSGTIPNPVEPPTGCRFHTRCPFAVDRCKHEEPELREAHPDRHVACHLVDADTIPTWG
jgi:oligopeptide/dipeptide ABC transporter ATP-binding protein